MSSLITEQDWLKWLDTGIICSDTLTKIAEKIKNKNFLDPRELSVYQFHGLEIELILKKLLTE
jgi:hypothetical protein